MTDGSEFVYAPIHATTLSEKGRDLVEEAITPACDFCLDTRVRWEYPCADFVLKKIQFGSQNGWLACERCSERIEAGDFGGLGVRSVRSWLNRHGELSRLRFDSIGQIQQGFFDHRNGPRIPYKGE